MNIFSKFDIGILPIRENTIRYLRLKKPIYDNYYLTQYGIIKFIFIGYLGKNKLLQAQIHVFPKEAKEFKI